MKVRAYRGLLIMAMISCGWSSAVNGVTIQNPADVLADGTAFVWVEGESVASVGGDDETVGYVVVNKTNPIKSNPDANKGNLDILPANTNASGGGGLLDQLGGGRHTNTATWEVQFTTPATYYLYVHATIYNSDTNASYGNEDSFYLPPDFNLNPREDWIDFVGEDQEGNPMTGDSDQDGWMPVFNNKVVMSAGNTETHNNTAEDFWDGNFHWMFADYAVDSDANGAYIDDYGMAIKYEITEAEINKPLTFTISTREHYSVIDGLLFATSNELLMSYEQSQMDGFFIDTNAGVAGDFNADGQLTVLDINDLTTQSAGGTNPAKYDLTGDAAVNNADVQRWVKDLKKSWIGDADLNGEFNSSDLVAVLAAGKYEVDTASVWADGDFNGDGRTNSGDLIAALSDGGYEQGPRAAVSAVPEPATGFAGLALLALAARKVRRKER